MTEESKFLEKFYQNIQNKIRVYRRDVRSVQFYTVL